MLYCSQQRLLKHMLSCRQSVKITATINITFISHIFANPFPQWNLCSLAHFYTVFMLHNTTTSFLRDNPIYIASSLDTSSCTNIVMCKARRTIEDEQKSSNPKFDLNMQFFSYNSLIMSCTMTISAMTVTTESTASTYKHIKYRFRKCHVLQLIV